jgi:hypothetical protein
MIAGSFLFYHPLENSKNTLHGWPVVGDNFLQAIIHFLRSYLDSKILPFGKL